VLTSLPLTIRAVLPATSRVRPRLRALDRRAASSIQVTAADRVNLAWLVEAAGDIARLDARVTELDKQIPALLVRLGCTLTQEYGIAAVSAMDLLVEVGDPTRFATEAQFARWCGAAPVAVSSGEGDQAPTHHRLDLAGNRQVNSTLHVMHVTQVRSYPPARDYIAKKRAEHKTKREARRAHKRHLANIVIRRMWADHTRRHAVSTPPPQRRLLDKGASSRPSPRSGLGLGSPRGPATGRPGWRWRSSFSSRPRPGGGP
jgi:transposase